VLTRSARMPFECVVYLLLLGAGCLSYTLLISQLLLYHLKGFNTG